jgi:hypothetical protein
MVKKDNQRLSDEAKVGRAGRAAFLELASDCFRGLPLACFTGWPGSHVGAHTAAAGHTVTANQPTNQTHALGRKQSRGHPQAVSNQLRAKDRELTVAQGKLAWAAQVGLGGGSGAWEGCFQGLARTGGG